eukprot:15453341-Alexandrium_andersonii.AAC.1
MAGPSAANPLDAAAGPGRRADSHRPGRRLQGRAPPWAHGGTDARTGPFRPHSKAPQRRGS